jgi:undecaprenol kinase
MFKFYKTFLFALNGVIELLKTERNFKIAAVCGLIAIALGNALNYLGQPLFRLEWAMIYLGIGLVLVSEALNSAIEKTLDRLHPEKHPMVGIAKDMAAGATLIASTVALIIGLFIFLPHLLALLN